MGYLYANKIIEINTKAGVPKDRNPDKLSKICSNEVPPSELFSTTCFIACSKTTLKAARALKTNISFKLLFTVLIIPSPISL